MLNTLKIPIESAKRMFSGKRYHKSITEKEQQEADAGLRAFCESIRGCLQDDPARLQFSQSISASNNWLIQELRQKEGVAV